MPPQIFKCQCGAEPAFRSNQFAEDYVDAWVECLSCGRHTEPVEDNYADYLTASAEWNSSHIREPQG